MRSSMLSSRSSPVDMVVVSAPPPPSMLSGSATKFFSFWFNANFHSSLKMTRARSRAVNEVKMYLFWLQCTFCFGSAWWNNSKMEKKTVSFISRLSLIFWPWARVDKERERKRRKNYVRLMVWYTPRNESRLFSFPEFYLFLHRITQEVTQVIERGKYSDRRFYSASVLSLNSYLTCPVSHVLLLLTVTRVRFPIVIALYRIAQNSSWDRVRNDLDGALLWDMRNVNVGYDCTCLPTQNRRMKTAIVLGQVETALNEDIADQGTTERDRLIIALLLALSTKGRY